MKSEDPNLDSEAQNEILEYCGDDSDLCASINHFLKTTEKLNPPKSNNQDLI